MSQEGGRLHSHERFTYAEYIDAPPIQVVVRDHLGALLADVAAHPGMPPADALGRTIFGPLPLPDDQQYLYQTCRYMIERQGHRVVEFDASSTYRGRNLAEQGFDGLLMPDGTVCVRAGSSRNMLRTLLHEQGHMLRPDLLQHVLGEYFSEAYSHVIGAYFGVWHPDTVRYLRCQSAGYTYRVYTLLTAEADAITQAATETITTIMGQDQP